jgi:hypothetical protein
MFLMHSLVLRLELFAVTLGLRGIELGAFGVAGHGASLGADAVGGLGALANLGALLVVGADAVARAVLLLGAAFEGLLSALLTWLWTLRCRRTLLAAALLAAACFALCDSQSRAARQNSG